MSARLHVCASCASPLERAKGGMVPGARLVRALRARLAGGPIEVVAERCIGPCDRPCASVLDLGARGAFLLVDLRPDLDVDRIVEAAHAALRGDADPTAHRRLRARRIRDWVPA